MSTVAWSPDAFFAAETETRARDSVAARYALGQYATGGPGASEAGAERPARTCRVCNDTRVWAGTHTRCPRCRSRKLDTTEEVK